MELGFIFLTSFLVALSGAMMPGPLLTLTIAESAKRGFIAGPLIILGHGILEGALVILILLGLSAFLEIPFLTKGIALLGGFFLIYLGWQMLKDARAEKERILAGKENIGSDEILHPPLYQEKASFFSWGKIYLVLAGIFVSISNPYWILWWATVGLGYLTVCLKQGIPALAVFFAGHIFSDLLWYSLISGMVSGGRRYWKPSAFNLLLMICGFFMVSLGGYFIYSTFS